MGVFGDLKVNGNVGDPQTLAHNVGHYWISVDMNEVDYIRDLIKILNFRSQLIDIVNRFTMSKYKVFIILD